MLGHDNRRWRTAEYAQSPHLRKHEQRGRQRTVEYVLGIQTSEGYSILEIIEVIEYYTVNQNFVHTWKVTVLEIHKAYDHYKSHPIYIEYATATELTRRTLLKNTVSRARCLLFAVKGAANDRHFQSEQLEFLKLQVLALQRRYLEVRPISLTQNVTIGGN